MHHLLHSRIWWIPFAALPMVGLAITQVLVVVGTGDLALLSGAAVAGGAAAVLSFAVPAAHGPFIVAIAVAALTLLLVSVFYVLVFARLLGSD